MPRSNLAHQALHRFPAEAHEVLLDRQFQSEHPLRIAASPTDLVVAVGLDLLNELSHQFLVHCVDLPVV